VVLLDDGWYIFSSGENANGILYNIKMGNGVHPVEIVWWRVMEVSGKPAAFARIFG